MAALLVRVTEWVDVSVSVMVGVSEAVDDCDGDRDNDADHDIEVLHVDEIEGVRLQFSDGVGDTERVGSFVAPGANCCVSLPHSKLP
ncbi:MAG: hypothetical protein ACK56I_29165 [bacterium]